MVSHTVQTPVGTIVVTSGDDGLRSISWRVDPAAPTDGSDPALDQLREYFAGTRRDFDLTIDLSRLEPLTRTVLEALGTVPYGSTITYGGLAELSGTGLPARAIGSVMGSNPVPLVIPCHRVLASDGLGGYSGGAPGQGIATKRWLLEHEGALTPTLI